MVLSTWPSHRPRRRAPLVLSRSGGRLGPCRELTDVEPIVAIHSSRTSCGAAAGHWRVGWGSPSLARPSVSAQKRRKQMRALLAAALFALGGGALGASKAPSSPA